MNKELNQQPDMTWLMKTIDKVVEKQRPLVVAHLREQRRKHPHRSPEQLIQKLEKQYLSAVSVGGAAVGATAVAPGIGTAAALGLTLAETVAFLEASAFFAQAVTEVHGIHVVDPERSKALVMSLMLGSAGSSLVRRVAEQSVGKGTARNAFWGQLITNNMPSGAMGTVVDYLRRAFVRRIARNTGTGMMGRALPFGIGAVIGGVGNHILGRQVVHNAREAFGPAPAYFTTDLDPQPKPVKQRKERGSVEEGFRSARQVEREGLTGGRKRRFPWSKSDADRS